MTKRIRNCFACFVGLLIVGVAGAAGKAVEAGKLAPDFVLPSVADGNLRLSEYRSEVVILSFWTDHCGRCEKAMPLYKSLYRQHQEAGLQVIGVAMDGNADEALELIGELDLNFPVLLDQDYQASRIFEPGRLPLTVVIDREGKIAHVDEGFGRNSDKRISAAVVDLITEDDE